jgi:hypothetical protein
VLRAAVCPIDVTGIGAVGDAKFRVGVIALRVGDARLAGRKAVPGLVQLRVSGARIARTRVRIGADPSEAREAAATATVPPAAAPFIGAAAIVVSLGDVVTRDRGVGRHALRTMLARVAGTGIGADAAEAGGAAAARFVEAAAAALIGAAVKRTIVGKAVIGADQGGVGAPALGIVVACLAGAQKQSLRHRRGAAASGKEPRDQTTEEASP